MLLVWFFCIMPFSANQKLVGKYGRLLCLALPIMAPVIVQHVGEGIHVYYESEYLLDGPTASIEEQH